MLSLFLTMVNSTRTIMSKIIETAIRLSININVARRIKAISTTADFVETHMSNIPSVNSRYKVHDIAIKNVKIKDGIVMEFGVFSGATINYIAELMPTSSVYGFDSFEGLPEFWRDGFDKNYFAVSALPKVRKNVELIKGWFDETLPTFAINGRKIAYLHVDCDLYSSTKTIFNNLKENIVEGTVIVFDEYFNHPGWQQGEVKAFEEFIAETKKEYKYLTYNRNHEQVAIIITKG